MENINPRQQTLAADNRLLEKITKARMINRKESRKHASLVTLLSYKQNLLHRVIHFSVSFSISDLVVQQT